MNTYAQGWALIAAAISVAAGGTVTGDPCCSITATPELKAETICTDFTYPNYSPTGTVMCYRHLPGGGGTLIQCIGDASMAAALKIPPCNAFLKK